MLRMKTRLTTIGLPLGVVVACLSILATSAEGQEFRTWSDNTGNFKVEAKFVKLVDGQVTLERKGGKSITLPISRLSADDQAIANNSGIAPTEPKKSSQAASSPDELLKAIKLRATAIWDDRFSFEDPKLMIGIVAKGKPAAEATHYGMLKLTSFVDQDGNDIKLRKEEFSNDDVTQDFLKVERPEESFFAAHPKNGLQIDVLIDTKNGAPTKIGKLAGQLEIRTGGIRQSFKIPNLNSLDGKEVSDPVAKEFGLTIKAELSKDGDRRNLEINVEGKIDQLLSLQIVGRNGKTPDNQNGWSNYFGDNSSVQSFEFDGDVPDDAVILVNVAKDTVKVVIPFEFESLKIPKKKK